jgi:peptide deformylase
MAIRNIRTDDDEILRKKSKKVDVINERVKILIEDMKETMYATEGVGLAAPQVGILKRIAVVDVGEGLVTVINPEIIERNGSYVDVEGCLSLPGRQGEVERPESIKVRALNEVGEEVVIHAEELFARALCHEIDHLDGILFIDRLIKKEEE